MNRLSASAMLLLAVLPVAGLARDHVDARDYPATGAGRAAFEQMERVLVRDFDAVCGDTFCEGEYSNLRALQLRCAVALDDGMVSGCVWSFAGSHASVSADQPLPQVEARTYACVLPLGQGTTLSSLLALLRDRDAIDLPLPGSGRSIYEGLMDCL